MRFGDGWYYVWYWSWFCGWSCLRLFDLVSKFFFSVFSVFFYNGGLGEPQILQLRSLTDPTFDIRCWQCLNRTGLVDLLLHAPVGELPHPGIHETHKGEPPPHVQKQKYTSTKSCEMTRFKKNNFFWSKFVAKWQNVKWEGSCGKPHAVGMPQICFFWPKCWTASNQNKKKTVLQEEVNHNSTPWSMGQKVSRKFWKPVSLPAQIEASTVHHGETNLLWNQLFAVSEDCNPRVSRSPPIWFAFEDVVTLCQKD